MTEKSTSKFDLRTAVVDYNEGTDQKTPAYLLENDYAAFVDLKPMLGVEVVEGTLYNLHELVIPTDEKASEAYYAEPEERYKEQGELLYCMGLCREELFSNLENDKKYIFLIMLLGYVANPTHYHLMMVEEAYASLDENEEERLIVSSNQEKTTEAYDFSSKHLKKLVTEEHLLEEKGGYSIYGHGIADALYTGIVSIMLEASSLEEIGKERFLSIREDIREYSNDIRMQSLILGRRKVERVILVQKYVNGTMHFVLVPTFDKGEVEVKNKWKIPEEHQRAEPDQVVRQLQKELIKNMAEVYQQQGIK